MGRHVDKHISFIAGLIHKILVFASIPYLAPEERRGKPTKGEGGKPGVNNRPATPIFRVLYRPSVISDFKKEAAIVSEEDASKGRVFKGRMGHLRRYKSDVFVKRKGTWDFLPPIPGPDGTIPTRVKIVKPALLTGLQRASVAGDSCSTVKIEPPRENPDALAREMLASLPQLRTS